MADPACVLTVIKKFKYRGNVNEEWSNQYALSGSTPANAAAWRTLFDALVLQEKTIYSTATSVVAGYGYSKVPVKGDSAVWSVDLTITPNTPVFGTLNTAASSATPGDDAVWVRWGLDRLNKHGKRIYLRKYFHDAYAVGGSFPDTPIATQVAALTAFGTKLRDGSFAESRTIVSPPDKDGAHGGLVPINSGVSAYITTRTLKRRGKRPPTSGT